MTEKIRLTPEMLANYHSGLCGISIGDGPCSCLVQWVKDLQDEADKLKIEKRGFQLMARSITEKAAFGMWALAMYDGNYERVGGDVECPTCRLPYLEHPELPGYPTFHLICSGEVVKT